MTSIRLDVMDSVLQMLVRLGRVVPADAWVDELVEQAKASRWDAIASV